MVPSLKTCAIVAVVSWLVIPSTVQLYQSFHAPRCPPDAKESACWRSLFDESESVDVFVYVTANRKLKWWTMRGLEELQTTPLWNTTSLLYGDTVLNTSVVVPLSAEALHVVRRNESNMYVHCYLIRAGNSVSGALKKMDDDTPAHRRIFNDLLHTSAPITRRLPMTKKPRRSLLGNNSTEGSNATEKDELVVVKTVPGLGWQVTLYPDELLSWTIAFFAVTAFLPPNVCLAAVRQLTAVVLVPWLAHERSTLKARHRAKQEQEQELDQQWWSSQGPAQISPHIVPKVRIALATDSESYDGRQPPPLLYKEMEFKDGIPIEKDVRYVAMTLHNAQGQKKALVPPLHVETWGVQQRYWRPLDANVSKGDIEVMFEFDVTGMWRYTVLQTLRQSLNMYMQFGFTERDLDDVRDFMFRHPLHIMALMQVIGFAQMTLTTLAFKNDISFFKGRKDYIGLSSRSLATDTIQDIIIFLYLFDYEDISRIVLFQVGMSTLIGGWKYIRVSRLSLLWAYLLPWFRPTRGLGDNQIEQDTEDIDAKGMRYLSWFLYPLSAAWGIYNVYNYTYKSWWSWLVSSLADFAYTFGFINMMPQIFINYKLKSVAHMPWRVLAYKFFNTFIDDFFAFFIMSDYMTKKHRFMTLRDDVVFFVFMYQRYQYGVDHTRADEFGYVYGEGDADAKAPPALPDGGSTDAGGKFAVYVDRAGKHRWRLQTATGDILLAATKGFDDDAACRETIEKVMQSSKLDSNFCREVQRDGKAFFTLCTSDGLKVGRSYGYKSGEDARDQGILSVMALAAAATVDDGQVGDDDVHEDAHEDIQE